MAGMPYLPIVTGSRAWALPADGEGLASHQWQVYVRSALGPNHNITNIIRKVQFELHETFLNPRRTISEPPFMLEEKGWGEFEVLVKISFVDSSQKPAELIHPLKLYGDPPRQMAPPEDPVVHELYDEILFPGLRPGVEGAVSETTGAFREAIEAHAKEFKESKQWSETWESTEKADLAFIQEMRRQVQAELHTVGSRLVELDQHLS